MNDHELADFLNQFRRLNAGAGPHVPVATIGTHLGLSEKMQGKLARMAGTLIQHQAAAGLVTAAKRSGDPNIFVGRLASAARTVPLSPGVTGSSR